ncbi:unnamed protein product [Brassica rapa subsp. trilocularis]
MAKGVQLFITFVMISMLISTETVGARKPLIKCISLLYFPCNPHDKGQCLRACRHKYKNTEIGTCKKIPPPPPGIRFLKMACDCEYMAVECS